MPIITNICGGLGNQMFQYAAGRALALRLGLELKYDLSWFGDMSGCTPRTFMLKAFPVAAVEATDREVKKLKYARRSLKDLIRRRSPAIATTFVQEPHHKFWPGFDEISSSSYLKGYWQNELYFLQYRQAILNDFSFPALEDSAAVRLAEDIGSSAESVCIHIRRGDYVSDPATNSYHGVCQPSYYSAALDLLRESISGVLSLFVFSDEPEWAKINFDTKGLKAYFAEIPEHREKPWHDMHLMSLCKHHIIANSSFSWWGAWLSAYPNKITVAPKNWFSADSMSTYSPVPSLWLTL